MDANQRDELFSETVRFDELPPELQPVYKSLQGDYTRKREADAASVRDANARIEELQSQLASSQDNLQKATEYGNSVEVLNTEWQQWNNTLIDKGILDREGKITADPGTGQPAAEPANQPAGSENPFTPEQVAYLKETLGKDLGVDVGTLATNYDNLNRRVNFNSHLDEILREDHGFKVNRSDVLKTAVDMGIDDPTMAFEKTYHDDILELEATKRADQIIKDRDLKAKDDLSGNVTAGSHLYTRPEGPRSYEEATAEIITDARNGGLPGQ